MAMHNKKKLKKPNQSTADENGEFENDFFGDITIENPGHLERGERFEEYGR